MNENKYIHIYDSSLRDGAQTRGVDFTLSDKLSISSELDKFGIDYIECGMPGANLVDDSFFADPPDFKFAKLTAFGMTLKSKDNYKMFDRLLSNKARCLCIVGKSWDYQVEIALSMSRQDNLSMIEDSLSFLSASGKEIMFDAEHFFDGWKSDKGYSLSCLEAALSGGAEWLVLCDTNGGTLPFEIEKIVGEVCNELGPAKIAIHCHDDTGNAVANSLAAVKAGACQIQGTFNNLGERCGNANLCSIIPTLILKMGYKTKIDADKLKNLSKLSRFIADNLNQELNPQLPYVGNYAFSHKGGIHASGVNKNPRTYEHIDPKEVGNERYIPVSGQSGRASIWSRLSSAGIEISADDERLKLVLDKVKEQEYKGYNYDSAAASFELLARKILQQDKLYFKVEGFRVIDERRFNAKGEIVMLSEACIKIECGDERRIICAEGNGPVNALDTALRQVLDKQYPSLSDMRLIDYKVRILSQSLSSDTASSIRVIISCADSAGVRWSTIGVSDNVIEASWLALLDAINWKLMRDKL